VTTCAPSPAGSSSANCASGIPERALSPSILAPLPRKQLAYSLPTASKKIQVQGMSTNSISLDDASGNLLARLLSAARERTVVVSLGSPYLVQAFPSTQNYLCTYSNAPLSEISAVRALYAEIPVRGRLPVTIPGIARRGYGLDLLPTTVAQGVSHAQP
jgi:hypothetical protein